MSIEMILAALSALVAVVVAAFSRGKSSGKKVSEHEALKQVKGRIDKAKEVQDETISKSDSSVSDALKSRWLRK